MLDDDRRGGADVARAIQRDPALTSRLPHAANPPHYARGGDRVAPVYAAIQRIGLGQVRVLCLVPGVVQAFSSRRRALSRDALWTHSASGGAAARLPATRAGLQGTLTADELYVGGHEVGVLVLDRFFPEQFARVVALRQEIELPTWQHEEDLLRISHGEVGGLLLGRGLLDPVVDAVTCHHPRSSRRRPVGPICRLTHAADVVCHGLARGLEDEAPVGTGTVEALAALGVASDWHAALVAEIEGLGGWAGGGIA